MDGTVAETAASRTGQTGLLAAAAVVPGSFVRSLTPRSYVDQGIITGIAAGVTYLLTVTTHDSIELVASRLASKLPLPSTVSEADRQRIAVLCTNLAVIPAGLAMQRALAPRPAEPTVRGLTRQVAWRWAATGVAGASLAAGQTAAAAVDRSLGTGGRLARFPVAMPVGLGIALMQEARRQRSLAAADDTSRASLLRALATAGGVVVVGSGLAYSERRLSRIVGSALSDVLPGSERFWTLTGDVATLTGFAAAVGVLYRRVIRKLEAGATAIDPIFTQISVRDVIGPTISGSEPSLVSWDSLGREGRRHGLAYVRPAPAEARPSGLPDLSIESVMGEPARATPVQVYIGLDSAPSMSERVELALAEMDRTGAWERSLIMLVSPTGTGYVNYCAVAAVQYLSRGDVATVTLQYSKRPSPLSLGKVRGAREQNRLLWLRILERLHGLPPDRRPRVVLFGESLGAHTSQDVLMHWGTLGPQALGIDRALWIGTPYASRWMQQVTGPARFDVDSDLVAVVNDFGQIEAMPQERRRKLRYVLLSHDNDGVTKFGPDLIVVPPRWLTDERPVIEDMPDVSPRGIPAGMRWRPLVTFVQLLVDMKNAQLPGVYRAYAHDYRPDLARFVREVFDLPCSDEQLAKLEDALEAREALRTRLFSDGLSRDEVPETTEPASRSDAPEGAR